MFSVPQCCHPGAAQPTRDLFEERLAFLAIALLKEIPHPVFTRPNPFGLATAGTG
jgi:hypothetical protein